MNCSHWSWTKLFPNSYIYPQIMVCYSILLWISPSCYILASMFSWQPFCPYQLLMSKPRFTNIIIYFGPSGVRAVPLAAGTNKGGHYFRYFSTSSSYSSSYHRYSKPQKGLSYCFKFLHGPLKKK